MDRYGPATNSSQISLPPKPHLKDTPISHYLRPEPPKLAGDRLRCTTYDSEISIFDAQRYFNEDQAPSFPSQNLTSTVAAATEKCNIWPNPGHACIPSDGFTGNLSSRSFHATPTASSEASWNSQAGLLRNPPLSLSFSVRSFPQSKQRKLHRTSSGRRLFGHSCPCFCNKSVDVKEKYHEPRIPIPLNNSPVTEMSRLEAEEMEATTKEIEEMAKIQILPGIRPDDPKIFQRFSLENRFTAAEIGRHIVNIDGFSFPIPAPPAEESARVSLEVFRPPPRKSAEFPFSCESGDRRSFILSPKTRPAVDDDVASDASSDLFEIESLSSLAFDPRKISTGVSRFWRGVDDEDVAAMSIAPSECYPPSEVSVEWSVTTAEGFDRASVANFSSAVSEYEELRYVEEAVGEGKKKGVGSGGGLLSCRSEKAVCVVGPNSARFGHETRRRVVDSDSAVALDRVVGVARLGGVNPVNDGSVAIGLCGRVRFP